jgi:hypothetical protein
MKPLPAAPDLLNVAPHVMWFEPPEKAIADPIRFMAYLMTYGTAEDLAVVSRYVDDAGFLEAVENAPPGIMDARSWAYWNVVCGKDQVPPMPVRVIPD